MMRTTPFTGAGLWLAAALLAGGADAAQARPGVSVGVSVGVPVDSAVVAYGYGRRPYYGGFYGGIWLGPWWGPNYVVVDPGVTYVVPAAPAPQPAISVPSSRPEPVIYPRNGQTAEQTESDRQDCNRWATTQPAAVADASVFHRAVEACMDGRGYTQK